MDAAGLEAGALDAGLEVGLAAAVIFLVAFFLAVAFLDPVVAAFLAVFFFAATFLTFFFVVRVPEAGRLRFVVWGIRHLGVSPWDVQPQYV